MVDMVRSWHREQQHYSFPHPRECNPRCPSKCSGSVCSHYTQVRAPPSPQLAQNGGGLDFCWGRWSPCRRSQRSLHARFCILLLWDEIPASVWFESQSLLQELFSLLCPHFLLITPLTPQRL